MEEIIKSITFQGIDTKYTISNFGIVRNTNDDNRMINPSPNKDGYLTVRLHIDGLTRTFFIHRLVATYFIDNPDGKTEVNHIDLNRSNNRADNLEWVSAKENSIHRSENKLINGITAKELVTNICNDLANSDATLDELSIKYNVTNEFIRRILNKNAWTNISSEFDFCNRVSNKSIKHKRNSNIIMESRFEDEVWKPIHINGLPTRYDVSNMGNIRSNGKLLITSYNTYKKCVIINLVIGDKRERERVHRLVAEAFVPNNDITKTEVLHINGNVEDNRASNLKWVTPSERMSTMYDRNGRERKYTHEQLLTAYKMYLDGKRMEDITSETGVPKSTIYDIKRGKSYTNIFEELTGIKKASICKSDKLQYIQNQILANLSDDAIIKNVMFNYGQSNTADLINKISQIRKILNINKWNEAIPLSDEIMYNGIKLNLRISNSGIMVNSTSNKFLFADRSSGGYLYKDIFIPELNRNARFYLHDLVGRCFLVNNDFSATMIGMKNPHDISNVSVDNLEWVTPKEWSKRMPPLEKDIVITMELLNVICYDIQNSLELSLKEIALKHQVPLHVVQRLYNKEEWEHITQNYDFSMRADSHVRRTGHTVIAAALLSGYKPRFISRHYGIEKSFIKARRSVLRTHGILLA